MPIVETAKSVLPNDGWTRASAALAEAFPSIETDHAYVDACRMWMIKYPDWFDVIVTTNMFGDIIPDLGAMLQGGLQRGAAQAAAHIQGENDGERLTAVFALGQDGDGCLRAVHDGLELLCGQLSNRSPVHCQHSDNEFCAPRLVSAHAAHLPAYRRDLT